MSKLSQLIEWKITGAESSIISVNISTLVAADISDSIEVFLGDSGQEFPTKEKDT
jgi:hypothetical protein